MKIGVIGGGAIAQFLLKHNIHVKSLLIRNRQRYQELASKYNVELFTDLDDFLASNINLVVEAANIEAVKEYVPKIIQRMDVIVISVGAFSDQAFAKEVFAKLETRGNQIHFPSGAIGGLDLIQNAKALDGLEEVVITTRKPAHTLVDEKLTSEKLIFSGSAREAIKKFPKNINVAIVLSLAGIGTEKTKVKIVADPNICKNEHTVFIKGSFGSSTLTVTNNPMQDNSNTSYLAALSILGTIQRLGSPVRIG